MPKDDAKVVTVDEGSGPVKVVKAPGGQILTKEQVALIRDKQQADLDKVTQLRDKLAASDAQAVAEIVGQVKDQLAQRVAMLDRQKAELETKRAKLEARDSTVTNEIVGRMVDRLSRRAERTAQARDRSAALLDELDGKPVK